MIVVLPRGVRISKEIHRPLRSYVGLPMMRGFHLLCRKKAIPPRSPSASVCTVKIVYGRDAWKLERYLVSSVSVVSIFLCMNASFSGLNPFPHSVAMNPSGTSVSRMSVMAEKVSVFVMLPMTLRHWSTNLLSR